MTEQREPIRKSLLPCTPPPEWEFATVLGAPHGCMLLPGDDGPIVIRRRASYGDWEPVRPDHWADEPSPDAARQAVASPATPADLRQAIKAALETADDHWCNLNQGTDFDALTDAVLAVLAERGLS